MTRWLFCIVLMSQSLGDPGSDLGEDSVYVDTSDYNWMEASMYCGEKYRWLCRNKGPHVACQHPVGAPGPLCKNYARFMLTPDVQNFIVSYVNRKRQSLAAGKEKGIFGTQIPRPRVMMLVKWDSELAYLAQRLADQCVFEHDYCRATVRYPYAGQTLGEVRWRRISTIVEKAFLLHGLKRVLDAWWGEIENAAPSQITGPFKPPPRGSSWGHFSQLAVWRLQGIGCGASKHGITPTKMLVVCDYSHTNMLNQRTIIPGPLSACPRNSRRFKDSPYPLLCTPVQHTDYFEEEPTREVDRNLESEPEVGYPLKSSKNDDSVGERLRQKMNEKLGQADVIDEEYAESSYSDENDESESTDPLSYGAPDQNVDNIDWALRNTLNAQHPTEVAPRFMKENMNSMWENRERMKMLDPDERPLFMAMKNQNSESRESVQSGDGAVRPLPNNPEYLFQQYRPYQFGRHEVQTVPPNVNHRSSSSKDSYLSNETPKPAGSIESDLYKDTGFTRVRPRNQDTEIK